MKTEIRASTQLCAVIGNPISHSLSPEIHNSAYHETGLDFVYVAFRVDNLQDAIAGMRSLDNFKGMSVTIPHKIEAIKYVDDVEEVDRHIGSINTIVKENDKLVGFGTDGPGALKALHDANIDLKNAHVLMLGCGGAARAIAFTLVKNAPLSELLLLDINKQLLDTLSTDLQKGSDCKIQSNVLTDDSLEQAMKRANIVIHCTPIGMHPNHDQSLIPKELFQANQVIFDIVYTPFETKLLKDAKSCGLKVIHGVNMFVNQAVLQFERFTGTQAPYEAMRHVVMEHLTK